MTAVDWKPVSVDQLRVGHFLRIGHRWFEHPFLLGSFRVSSPAEIAIIRSAGLARLFIDPARSNHDTTLATGAADAATAGPDDPQVVADNERLKGQKAQHAADVRRHHWLLDRTHADYDSAATECLEIQRLLIAGDGDAAERSDGLVRSVLQAVTATDTPLCLARGGHPADASRRMAHGALDALAIAGSVGRHMGLDADTLHTLGQSALLHAVGLQRLPLLLRDETVLTGRNELLEFQDYPLHGSELLRACGGISYDVVKIVRQHRERLDGSGFPEAIAGDEIHTLARVVGAIREFLLLTTSAQPMMPAAALSHLYRNLRGAYGADVVDPLIAALTIYPPGSYLNLSDGSVGRVIRISERQRLRPTVWIYDASLQPAEADIVDLEKMRGIDVQSVLDPRRLLREVVEFFGGAGWSGLALSDPARASVPEL